MSCNFCGIALGLGSFAYFLIRCGRLIRHLPSHLKAVVHSFRAFEHPLSILSAYFFRSHVPKSVVLKGGIELFTSGSNLDVVTMYVIFAKREYGNIEKNDIVMDLGANIGSLSVYALQLGAQRVISVEPNPSSFQTLQKNISQKKFSQRCQVYPNAVHARAGLTLYIPTESNPSNAMVSEGSEGHVEVKTIALGNLVDDVEKIDLLKVDIEGGEYQLFDELTNEQWAKILKIRMEYHNGPFLSLVDLFSKQGLLLEKQIIFSGVSGLAWFKRAPL